MLGSSAPAPPNMTQAATNDVATQRPTINTPFGSLNWTQTPTGGTPIPQQVQSEIDKLNSDGGLGQGLANQIQSQWESQHGGPAGVPTWSANVSLTPDQQAALDNQQKIQNQQMGLAEELQGQTANRLADPVQLQTTLDPQARSQAIDANYQSQTQYLDPQFQQEQQALQQQLAGQGLAPGDAAYDTAMANFGRQKQQAYSNANMQAINAGNQTEQTQLGAMGFENQQAMANQMLPLNEMLAVENGQQVQMPNFNVPGAQAPSSYLPAAENQYQALLGQFGANQAMQGGMMSGIGSLASLPFML